MKKERTWRKTGYAMVLVITMVVGILAGTETSEAATTGIPDGYTPIYTVEDLYGINNNLEGNYILMNDIDLSGTAPGGEWDSGHGWTPIGMGAEEPDWCSSFTGNFDGNGYRIKNMTIYYEGFERGSYSPKIGLFGCIGAGENFDDGVKNLALENINISVTGEAEDIYCGGIAGEASGTGKIDSCFVTGNISITSNSKYVNDEEGDEKTESKSLDGIYVGGIIGTGLNKHVENCYADITFGGNAKCAGIADLSGGWSASANYPRVRNCYATAQCEGESKLQLAVAYECEQSYYPAVQGAGCGIEDEKDTYATPLTAAQMKSEKFYTGFDFNRIWIVDKNSPYPYPQLRKCMQVRTESVELVSEPDKTSYYTTDKLDLSGAELKINYEDNYSTTVPLTESMLTYEMSEGTQTVVVNYNGCKAEFDITVKKRPESLKITAKKTKLKVGASYKYKVKYVGDGKVTFTSSNPRVLRINKTTGKAVAKKAGTATITIKAGKLTKKIKVKVVK